MAPDTGELAAVLAEAGVETLVNLDGRWGDELVANLERYDRAAPGTYVTFCHVEWAQLADSGGPDDRDVVERLSRTAGGVGPGGCPRGQGVEGPRALGARRYRHAGTPRRRPRGRGAAGRGRAGTAGADPHRRPGRVLRSARRAQRAARGAGCDAALVVRRTRAPDLRRADRRAAPAWSGHARATTFIGAHVGCHAEDLGARRRRARRSCPTGTSTPAGGWPSWAASRVRSGGWSRPSPTGCCSAPTASRRTLPTTGAGSASSRPTTSTSAYVDEGELPPFGRWRISGAALPRTLLAAVYRDNAHRLLGL